MDNKNNTTDPVMEAKRAQVAKDVEKIITDAGFTLLPFIEHTNVGALIPRVTIVPVPQKVEANDSVKTDVEPEAKTA